MVDEFSQAQVPGQGGRQEQAGIGHQAMVVKEDADTVGFVLWQHLLGAPCFRAGFCSKTIIPDSEEHPLASSRTVLKAVLRWIRAYSPWHVTRVAARSRPRVRTTLSTVANSGLPLGGYQVRDESLTDVFPVGRQEGWQLELLGIGRLGLAIGTLLTGGLGTITSSRLQAH